MSTPTMSIGNILCCLNSPNIWTGDVRFFKNNAFWENLALRESKQHIYILVISMVRGKINYFVENKESPMFSMKVVLAQV